MKLLINSDKTTYGKKVFVFNLPAPETCKPTSWCLIHCPSLKANLNIHFKKVALKKYAITKSKNFPDMIIDEIKKKKIKFVRVHSSGDFYSSTYIKKWKKIANSCPNTIFRTSTKRVEFIKTLLDLNNLPNFIIRESIDPAKPNPVTNLPLSAIETVPMAKNFFRCTRNCEKCGYYCWYHRVNEYSPILTPKQWEKACL